MNKKSIMFTLAILLLCLSSNLNASENNLNTSSKDDKFSFVYMTDLHLNYGHNNCFDWFDKAIKKAESNGADFILTGGDNVDIDGLKDDYETANRLFTRFTDSIKNSNIPFYASMGNHDRFWAASKEDPLYNEGLFEKHLNKSYYSFDHKGWHFIVLNTSNYVVDEKQKEWLKNDLEQLDSITPTIVSVHVPFLTVYYPALEGKYTDKHTVSNFKEIWDMFENKNLKLVLQGHMHLYEEIKVKGVQFITAGSLSGWWWGDLYYGTDLGYLVVNLSDDDFDWEYVSIGWEKKKKK